jgi:hypothetical protein
VAVPASYRVASVRSLPGPAAFIHCPCPLATPHSYLKSLQTTPPSILNPPVPATPRSTLLDLVESRCVAWHSNLLIHGGVTSPLQLATTVTSDGAMSPTPIVCRTLQDGLQMCDDGDDVEVICIPNDGGRCFVIRLASVRLASAVAARARVVEKDVDLGRGEALSDSDRKYIGESEVIVRPKKDRIAWRKQIRDIIMED